jgi:uncharacterized protein (DUF58 family)
MDASEILGLVRRIEIATRRAANAELAGRYHSVFKGQGMAFSEVRPYAPGDDVRHIDWNVSARHNGQGLFVKQFVEERELTVMLLVDLSGSGDFATRGRTKRERLAQAGALIAFSAIQNNDRVGLVLFTDQIELFVPPRKGRKHVLRVIREIASAEPHGHRTRIGDALAYLSRVQKRRSVCFVLSDWLDTGWDRPLQLAQARHDVIAVRIADAAERQLPDLGIIELEDAETGQRRLVDTGSKAVRDAFAKKSRDQRAAVERRLGQLGCDVVELETAPPKAHADEELAAVLAPLVRFFRTRAARLRGGR